MHYGSKTVNNFQTLPKIHCEADSLLAVKYKSNPKTEKWQWQLPDPEATSGEMGDKHKQWVNLGMWLLNFIK